jgi:hypothetical protein
VAVPEYSQLPSLIFASNQPIRETVAIPSGRSYLLAKMTLPGIVWPDVTMWADPTLGPNSIFKFGGDIIGSVWTLNETRKRRKIIEGNQMGRRRCNTMLKMVVCHDISRRQGYWLNYPAPRMMQLHNSFISVVFLSGSKNMFPQCAFLFTRVLKAKGVEETEDYCRHVINRSSRDIPSSSLAHYLSSRLVIHSHI